MERRLLFQRKILRRPADQESVLPREQLPGLLLVVIAQSIA
jgi:hypothetical protein